MTSDQAATGEELLRIDDELRRCRRESLAFAFVMVAGMMGLLIGAVVASTSPNGSYLWAAPISSTLLLLASIVLLIARTRRMRRTCRRIIDIFDATPNVELRSIPIAAGERIGNMIVLERTEDAVHCALRRGAHQRVAIFNALLLAGSLLMGATAILGIVTWIHDLVAGHKTSHSPDLLRTLLVGVGSVPIFRLAIRRTPIQWIATRSDATLRIERVRRVSTRELVEIPATSIQGYEVAEVGLRVIQHDATIEPLVQLTPMLEALNSAFHPTAKLRRDKLGTAPVLFREWQARRLALVLGSVLRPGEPVRFRMDGSNDESPTSAEDPPSEHEP